jgi:TPR repeat protein
MRLLGLALFALVLSGSCSIADQSPNAIEQCAKLAAYIWEPGYRDTGVDWDGINLVSALPACETAHAAAPEDTPTTYRLARVHFQRHDFDKAVPLMLQASEEGYAPAQAAYGTAFLTGNGVDRDYAVAFQWLSAAARNGDPTGKANLGRMYDGKYGIPANRNLFMSLQLEAAHAGVDFAQYNVAQNYYAGYGIKQDLGAAKWWYRLAANQGHILAQRTLALILNAEAVGTEDYDEPFRLLSAAAGAGDAQATTVLGTMYLRGWGTAVDLPKARDLYQQGYELGDSEAARLLGNVFEFGRGVPADQEQALGYYLQSANMGNTEAQYRVGHFVSQGLGGSIKDQAAALVWFLKAANQGNLQAQIRAAEIYEYKLAGQLAPLYDTEKALYWYDLAARSGSLEATLRAARLYAFKYEFETAESYVTHVLQYGDDTLKAEAQRMLETVQFVRRTRRMPT